ncbi:MAG: dihydroneopterin aldolase [Salinivirgaceae bacterium]|jgi:dihydroneopterin aldolase|nr:dihydroneopterin aldolase [Bacteroidales bacterium]HPW65841.1 dihydroneopterin aldolase [Salinivirgaceae bacterium]
MGTIELEKMEFFAYHGCYKEEKVVGNYFLVDLKFNTDCNPAIRSDSLSDTINYLEIYELIKKEMEIKSNLLENVAGRIINRLYAELPERISNVTVKIRKMNPPLGGKVESVSVSLTR